MTTHATGTRSEWLAARLELRHGSPRQPRRDALRRLESAAREAAGLQAAHGWTFPWASSYGSDFNYDFSVGFTEEQQLGGGIEYNYRREPPRPAAPPRMPPDTATTFAAMSGTDAATFTRERPGMSAFVLDDGVVYHTYSAYARGLDALWGMYQWLDRAPRGRNESDAWWRRHDEYGKR
jgi:predicted dithiol-disulfide oxidoreductase (DUF899 family)